MREDLFSRIPIDLNWDEVELLVLYLESNFDRGDIENRLYFKVKKMQEMFLDQDIKIRQKLRCKECNGTGRKYKDRVG